MTWLTIICFAPALAWTVISFAAYSDLDFAFRSSLIGWLICGGALAAGRLIFSGLAKRVKAPKKVKMLNRRRLAIAGAIVAIFVLTVLTLQWLGKRNVRSGTESVSTKQKLPAKDQPKDNKTETRKAEGLWSVQVAAFRSEQDAVKLATALKDRGWEAYVTSADVNAVTLYRTNVGRFRTREAAERLRLKLRDQEAYATAFVVSM